MTRTEFAADFAARTDYQAIRRQMRDFGPRINREQKSAYGALSRRAQELIDFDGLTYEERYQIGLERFDAQQAQRAMQAEGGPATGPQVAYLRRLGYKGSTQISKREASRLIDTLKNLSASDVDDFTGPQYTW